MAATLDEGRFFASVRDSLFGSLNQSQVDGLKALLAACPPDFPTDHLAYCLATTFHETARTMQPIEEYGRGKGKTYGVPDGPYRQVYYGRGFVQLTWLANYRRATSELLSRGYLIPGEDLERTPALAMRLDVAAAILFIGSAEGWFTGKRLSKYFAKGISDPVNARRIINGLDRADTIAGYFGSFRTALVAAGHQPGGVVIVAPVPKVETKPLSAPTAPVTPTPTAPAKPGFWATLFGWANKPAG